MTDPFAAWSRMMRAACDMSMIGLRAAETAKASGEVVSARAPMIGAALSAPWDADLGELNRMIPEKVEAFSAAGSAVMRGWWAMQAAWLAEAQAIGAAMARGRMPTAGEMAVSASRSSTTALVMMESAVRTGSQALAPVHRKAVGNARRLRKRA